jgi:glutaredoxin
MVDMAENIKVYALSTCPYCKRTKRFLDEHKVKYEAVDVDLLDDDSQDVALKEIEKLTGRQSFPVVVVGKDVIVGHNEAELRRCLRL